MTLRAEIGEQPEVLQRLLRRQSDQAAEIARDVRARGAQYVYLAARGTSDNAGRYAQYVWGSLARLPVALASPSLFGVYGRPPELRGALVVGISQSGQSPDIVAVLTEARRQGAPTLALTNDPSSPLAATADFVLDLCAGVEEAVAATKTYTASLTSIALLAAELAADPLRREELQGVPDWVQQVLALDDELAGVVERFRAMDRCVVLGRGFNYATAFEWSLKLKELTGVVAEPYSPSDFQHGPVAIVDRGFPVLAALPAGPVVAGALPLLRSLVADRGAELLVLSNDEEALAAAATPVRLPTGLPEWLSAIVAIVPAQLFCYHLARAKGWNTEKPAGLSKVTRTL